MGINLSVRETTLYTVELRDGEVYETFDADKARQMEAFFASGIPAAECMDCHAVIPVFLVDVMGSSVRDFLVNGQVSRLRNSCPATLSLHHSGHRVLQTVYDAAKAGGWT